jgi:SNF2 family DNA or RNA helicase
MRQGEAREETQVIRIDATVNRLTVTTDGHDPILSGTHRAYFETILNLRRRTDGQGYEWGQMGRIAEQLREVCDYLEENSMEYQLEEEATRLLARIRGAETRLAAAIAAGREVLERADLEAPRVEGLKRPLLPHQWRPVHHLLEVPNAANFSVPGAGKTAMVLAAFQRLKGEGAIDCLVVIGPGSSFLAWEEELQQSLVNPGAVIRLSGGPEERLAAYRRAQEADLILVTYNTANNDEQQLIEFLRSRKCLLVLDESHYVKGSGAFADAVLALAPEAERRIILTGTPMPNGFTDLWTQTAFLWPEQHLFGNRLQFRSLVGNEAGQNAAKAKVRPLFTRVRKSDLHLPEQKYRRVPVSMGPVQQRIYAALSARTLNDVSLIPAERVVLREWRKAKMVRLLQAASNPALLAQESIEFSVPPEDALDRPLLELIASYLKYEMPRKILVADQLVRNILEDPNEKVVVWTHFVRNIELLMELLKDFGARALYGAIPREGPDEEEETRERNIKAFREDPRTRVLVANPGAAAESISLHKVSHHAIYLDRTFNAGQFIQSRDRIHRVGLGPNEDVTYHLLISEESIDETVDVRLLAKEQRMAELLEDPELPTVGVQIATDHLSGPDEGEEEVDFDAVIEDIRQRLERRQRG